jgi:8-oxo-dGTP diphosphatase
VTDPGSSATGAGGDPAAPPTVVVAAAILDDGRLLAARRSSPAELAGGWELPGGKVELGEPEEAALVRECREELGVEVAVGRRVGGDWPLQRGYVLRVWTATITAGQPAPLEDHSEVRWLEPGHWESVAWLAADLPVVAAVRRACRPGG